MNIIKLDLIFTSNILTRSQINEIRDLVKKDELNLVIFDKIQIQSRGVADELVDLAFEAKVFYVKMNTTSRQIYDKVLYSRFMPRIRDVSDTDIVQCNTMSDLFNYLNQKKE